MPASGDGDILGVCIVEPQLRATAGLRVPAEEPQRVGDQPAHRRNAYRIAEAEPCLTNAGLDRESFPLPAGGAYSRPLRGRILAVPLRPSTRNWTLLPPYGVRRQPASRSPRTSPTVRPLRTRRNIVATPSCSPSSSDRTRSRCAGAIAFTSSCTRSCDHHVESSSGASSRTETSGLRVPRGGSGRGSSINGRSELARWKRRTFRGRIAEMSPAGGKAVSSRSRLRATTKSRGRLCGTNQRASTTTMSMT